MKFYSEVTGILYDTKEQLEEAEAKVKTKNSEFIKEMEEDEANLIESLEKITKFMNEAFSEIQKSCRKLDDDYDDFVETYDRKPDKFLKKYKEALSEFEKDGEDNRGVVVFKNNKEFVDKLIDELFGAF